MSDVKHFAHIVTRAPRYDVTVLLVTFLLTVFTNLVVAVNIGVILSMLFFTRRMHQSVTIEAEAHPNETARTTNGEALLPEDVIVYNIQGPFFFGVAEKLEHALHASNLDPKAIIFRLKAVPFMDMTGLETFSEIIEEYHKRGVLVYLCEANPKVLHKFAHLGILKFVVENRVFENLKDILN